MSRKSMVQGYKIQIVPVQVRKKGECGTLFCKNDDRHPYDKRNMDTATKLNQPEFEKSDRETGGTMC